MARKRAVITKYGGTGSLQMLEEEDAPPGKNEVRIAVLRAGVAYGDIMACRGVFPLQKGKTPGFDVVGRIAAVGKSVACWQVGDLVGALTISNGYSSSVTVPAAELVAIPEGVTIDQAAALLLNYVTAYQILKRHCRVKPGSRVFVQGLSGGLGNAFLDLQHTFQVRIYGTASPGKFDWVEARGGVPFDYRADYVGLFKAAVPEGADVVVDGIGGKNFSRSYALLHPRGRLVGIGYGGNSFGGFLASLLRLFAMRLSGKGPRISFYSVVLRKASAPRELFADLQVLLSLLQQGKINPCIHAVVPFERVVEALQLLEKGSVKGKVILSMTLHGPEGQ